MRSPERVIELIDSMGDGVEPIAFVGLNLARDVIAGCYDQGAVLRLLLAGIVRKHPSPHIRDLAAEALHYVEANNG